MSKIVDLVSLASIVPPLNHEVSGGFNAIVDGKQVRVRAVLERTVVIEHQEGGERSVVRKDNCMVKPSAVAFVPGNPNNGVGPRQWRRLPGKPPATPQGRPLASSRSRTLLWRGPPSIGAPPPAPDAPTAAEFRPRRAGTQPSLLSSHARGAPRV